MKDILTNAYIMYEKGEKREKGEMGTLSYLEEGSVYKINKFIRAYIIIKQKNYLNPYFPLFPFFPFFPHHFFLLFSVYLKTKSYFWLRLSSYAPVGAQALRGIPRLDVQEKKTSIPLVYLKKKLYLCKWY